MHFTKCVPLEYHEQRSEQRKCCHWFSNCLKISFAGRNNCSVKWTELSPIPLSSSGKWSYLNAFLLVRLQILKFQPEQNTPTSSAWKWWPAQHSNLICWGANTPHGTTYNELIILTAVKMKHTQCRDVQMPFHRPQEPSEHTLTWSLSAGYKSEMCWAFTGAQCPTAARGKLLASLFQRTSGCCVCV